jgi:hypothetical protein
MHQGPHYFHNPDDLFIEIRLEDLFICKAKTFIRPSINTTNTHFPLELIGRQRQ